MRNGAHDLRRLALFCLAWAACIGSAVAAQEPPAGAGWQSAAFPTFGVSLSLPPGTLRTVDTPDDVMHHNVLLQWDPAEAGADLWRCELLVTPLAATDLESIKQQTSQLARDLAELHAGESPAPVTVDTLAGVAWARWSGRTTADDVPGAKQLAIWRCGNGWRAYTLLCFCGNEAELAASQPLMRQIAATVRLAPAYDPAALRWDEYSPPGSGVHFRLPEQGSYLDGNSADEDELGAPELDVELAEWLHETLPLQHLTVGWLLPDTTRPRSADGYAQWTAELAGDATPGPSPEATWLDTPAGRWQLRQGPAASEAPQWQRSVASLPLGQRTLVVIADGDASRAAPSLAFLEEFLRSVEIHAPSPAFNLPRQAFDFPRQGLSCELPMIGMLIPPPASAPDSAVWLSLTTPLMLAFVLRAPTDLEPGQTLTADELDWLMQQHLHDFEQHGLDYQGMLFTWRRRQPRMETFLSSWYGFACTTAAPQMAGTELVYYMTIVGEQTYVLGFAYAEQNREQAQAVIEAVLPTCTLWTAGADAAAPPALPAAVPPAAP